MAIYFTDVGPEEGPYLHRDAQGRAIHVLMYPTARRPIGMALPARWADASVALWRLTVHGAEVPGLWVVVDREFRPVQ
jgi:hypothetical protein